MVGSLRHRLGVTSYLDHQSIFWITMQQGQHTPNVSELQLLHGASPKSSYARKRPENPVRESVKPQQHIGWSVATYFSNPPFNSALAFEHTSIKLLGSLRACLFQTSSELKCAQGFVHWRQDGLRNPLISWRSVIFCVFRIHFCLKKAKLRLAEVLLH